MKIAVNHVVLDRVQIEHDDKAWRHPEVWIDRDKVHGFPSAVKIFDFPLYEVRTRKPALGVARVWVLHVYARPVGPPLSFHRIREVRDDPELAAMIDETAKGDAPVWALVDMLKEKLPEYGEAFDHYLGEIQCSSASTGPPTGFGPKS